MYIDDASDDGTKPASGGIITNAGNSGGQTSPTGSQSVSGTASGSVGQSVAQRINGSGNPTLANPSITNGATWHPPATGSAGMVTTTASGTKITWNGVGQLASITKPTTKKKVRYVIVKRDQSTLELQERLMITPEEMIGLSKFISLVSTYTILVLGQAVMEYNFNVSWSDLIESLNISKHFAPGLAPADYDKDASEVLDILLYDPQ